jgi:hypothetical protein
MSKLSTKLKEEFKALLPPALFFFVMLHLIALIRVLMLKGTGIALSTSWQVTLSALILGKAVLVADWLPFINRYPDKPLDLQYRLENDDIRAGGHATPLPGAPRRLLERGRESRGRQPEVARGDRVAAFLGHPNSPGCADSDLLHHA